MNNDWKDNKQNKVTDFLKRNVFYIVLFLCLCIIGGISVYMNIRSNTKSVSVGNQSKIKSKVQSKGKTSQVNNNGNAAKEKMENAKQVNQNQNLIKKDSQTAQTSTANIAKKSFIAPVENGKIVVKFDTWHSKDGKYTNIPGEYISPSKNSNVVATCDGVVKSIDSGKVTISNTQSGYTTVYDNLDEKSISLKVNDNVKQGQVLGKIGDSNYSNKLITNSSCLYFEIDQKQNDGTYLAVDPEKVLIH